MFYIVKGVFSLFRGKTSVKSGEKIFYGQYYKERDKGHFTNINYMVKLEKQYAKKA